MSKKTKESKGIAGLMLFFGWMVFILLAVVFYFYFLQDLDLDKYLKKETKATTEQPAGFSYETNANLDINSLIIEYYAALAVCDQDKLKSCVVDATAFDDMNVYQQRATVITNYSNINCYTLPGYTADAILVYVTSNLTLENISSLPLNINRFYILSTPEGYKIDNRALDQTVTDYIEEQSRTPDIQNLYRAVQENVDSCVANDPAFAEFYSTISSSK